jgi:Response regulator containing a CheY-like receiver domain and an HTH DNA-binding domain
MSSSYTAIDIILADVHEIYRDGFNVMMNKIPEINLVAEASNGVELIRLAHKLNPDVIITDIKMPRMDGIQATKLLKHQLPNIGIIALSMLDEEDLIVDMLEAGANGYLLKNASKEQIVTAVKCVHKDESYFCRDVSNKLPQMVARSNFNPYKKAIKPEFSDKEISIIKLICAEYLNKEIANTLNLSKRTVEGYREKILEKIEAKNTAGIVVYAMRNKIYM